jgi:hypothetical protein
VKRRTDWHRLNWQCRIVAVTAGVMLSMLTACGTSVADPPSCGSVERVGLIAQSVPSASYVPCITALPQGWSSRRFEVRSGRVRFSLLSDRAHGRAVEVELRSSCDLAGATLMPPRSVGGRTYLELRSIDPRYAGTMYDVFPGGCVTYTFDLDRGPHIALMADLNSMVGLVSRRQLNLDLRHKLGVELDR